MSQIYKIFHNVNNNIVKVYIFFGSKINAENKYTNEILIKLFEEDPQNEVFKDIFTMDEFIDIQTNKINISFINDSIYIDDTIETVKKKLCFNIDVDVRLSYDEIYLFYQQERKLEPTIVYQDLTQNETIELTRDRLIQFLLNISYENIATIPVKDVYNYNDIIALDLDIYAVNRSLGQQFKSVKKTYPFTINPFDVLSYDPFLERNAEDITSTTNHNLLLESLPIFNNNIYLCCAADVLQYAETQELSQESTVKIYYPYLLENNIINIEQLFAKKEELLISTEQLTGKFFQKTSKDIKLFYDIKEQSIEPLPWQDIGIKTIEFTLKPQYDFILPLDIVFKLIHATVSVPFIKYNPGRRKEKIYRLYAPMTAKNGKKIPFLKKSVIYKLIKNIGNEKSVSVYIEKTLDSTKKHICIIEFYASGSIYVKTLFHNIIPQDEIDEIISDCILPITNIVENFLSQSGYTMNSFTSINTSNVDIINMEYSFKIAIKNTIQLDSYYGCLSSVFNILQPNVRNGAVLRFKRVSNYNEMDGQEALIVSLLNSGNNRNEIIQSLIDNYKLDEKSAREKLGSFVGQLQVMETAYQEKKLKIKNNPGFLTTITSEKFTNNILITVNNINNIKYLETIPIYIESLIRLTQDMSIPNISKEKIHKLCITKTPDPSMESSIADIVGAVENPEIAALPLTIVADSLQFEELDKDDDGDESDTMLDIIMDSDEDTDEDSESDDSDSDGGGINSDDVRALDDDEVIIGGTNSSKDSYKKDLTGLSLNNPNPFSKRMESRDPALFVYDEGKNFKAYSRSCPWNLRRQPVILTQDEKNNIDKNHPGSYDMAVEYGSSEEKKHWYICPRYWSLTDNTSLTKEEVDSGKYGKIIPSNAKTVPKDANIFEFTSKIHKNKDGSYANLYPGFLKQDIHPNSKCMPCCFKSWSSKEQIKRREQCTTNSDTAPPQLVRQQSDILDDYIKAPNKFPLAQTRLGFLPLAIQRYLNIDNKKCQISASNTNIKLNYKCLLRYGVQNNINQSFISCIGTILPDQTKTPTDILTIKKTKKKLVKALSLDLFITLQNGTLIENFSEAFPEDVKIEKYNTSKIYNITDKDNDGQVVLLKKMVHAYENFIEYINNDNILIDYTYLWDLICTPNPKLFNSGINLIILEITNNDITDNVQLICPSNHYSSVFFDINKPCIILIKKDNLYEPIIQYKETSSTYEIKKRFFLQKSKDISPEFVKILMFIKQSLNTKCGVLPSLPKIYKFKENIPLIKMIELLKKKNYTILSQIMNYNGKIISIHVEKGNMKGILPCRPSSPILDLIGDIIWMDDDYGYTYEKTIKFLEHVYKDFNGEIPCSPSLKVFENELIIGVITITNQFIILSEPAQDLFGDDYPSISGMNYNAVDKIVLTENTTDVERFMNIKKIKLESAFFRIFRNTIRVFLGTFNNRLIRQQVEQIINSPTLLYLEKLDNLVSLLRKITTPLFKFADYTDKVIEKLTTITNCYNNDSTCKEKTYCFPRDDRTCSLLIPKTNLINGMDNEEIYYGRLADELVRYQRIKTFIFQPKVFLTFENIKYNLNNDEIILLQSLLMSNYFDDLTPMITNSYIKYNAYDNSEPMQSQPYNNTILYNTEVTYDKKEDSPKLKIQKIKKKKKIKHIKLVEKEMLPKGLPAEAEPAEAEPAEAQPAEAQPAEAEPAEAEPAEAQPAEAQPAEECPNSKLKALPTRWKGVFTPKIKAIEYKNGKHICTYTLLNRIILDNSQINLDKPQIQAVLLEEYARYLIKYNIEKIWKAQGKSKLFTKLRQGVSLRSIILDPKYYITNIDIWILSVKYNIPIILVSSTILQENGDSVKEEEEKYIFILNSDDSRAYYYIKPSATAHDGATKVPTYRLLIENQIIKLPITTLSYKWRDYVNESKDKNILEEFLLKGNILQKKKKRKLIIKET